MEAMLLLLLAEWIASTWHIMMMQQTSRSSEALANSQPGCRNPSPTLQKKRRSTKHLRQNHIDRQSTRGTQAPVPLLDHWAAWITKQAMPSNCTPLPLPSHCCGSLCCCSNQNPNCFMLLQQIETNHSHTCTTPNHHESPRNGMEAAAAV
jgi:hypothetical protein